MSLKTVLLSSLLALTSIPASSAIPLEEDSSPNLHARAGAPVPRPIPSNCNIDTPVPTFQPPSSSFQTKQIANSTAILYYYFLSTDSPMNQTMCMQQCYGYGDGTQCKAVFMANNALTPPGYLGTAGGDQRNACIMFKRRLIMNDFEPAKVAGTYQSAMAKNIICPPQTTDSIAPTSTIPTSTIPSSTPVQTTSATTSSLIAPVATTSAGGAPASPVSTPTVQPSSCPPLSFD